MLIYCTHLGRLPSLQTWWTEFWVHQLMPYYTKILRNLAYQTFEFHSILIKVQFDWSFFVFVHYHGDQLPHCTTTMEKWVAPPRASRMVISWLQVWDAFSKHERYLEIFFPLHVSRPTKQKLLAMHHIWNTYIWMRFLVVDFRNILHKIKITRINQYVFNQMIICWIFVYTLVIEMHDSTISMLVFTWLHTVNVLRRNRSLSNSARTINSFDINFYLRKQLTSLSKVKNVENSNAHSSPEISNIFCFIAMKCMI